MIEELGITPYRKRVKGKIYRWVIQLPAGVDEVPDTVYVVSKKPLVVAETPELPTAKPRCDKEAVRLLREKIESKAFRKAVGGAVVDAIESLLKLCE
ncbi:MAG: hypothetical protein ACO2PN_08015 [Pyrobaculum sp.]|jgi:hypothetical protein